ncbi:MAG TPA: DUF2147 domain-containing protein [Rhizomicrobium sp.]|nr:DUF2147 domain-containing protein [Rhizomicrobium sp.]
MAATTPATAAASVFGLWATAKNNGRVRIEPCGEALCGRVVDGNQLHANAQQMDVKNPDPSKRTRHVKGLMILTGYTGGPERWEGGNVYDPQTGDQSSDSTLTLVSPDTLKVRGCNIVFCRSEIWTRAN